LGKYFARRSPPNVSLEFKEYAEKVQTVTNEKPLTARGIFFVQYFGDRTGEG
jgi:hypothetical protein